MRLGAGSNIARGWIVAAAALLGLAACGSGEAAPSPQPQNEARLKLMRGYGCTQAVIAGRYSCARSLDRQAQRAAAARAPSGCRSC